MKYEELERATNILRSFSGDSGEEDNTEAADEIDLEKLLPLLDEQLEEIKEEEANELLSDLRTEASTVYVNKKDKYSDLKFSGLSFLIFAILGYLFILINAAGVLHMFNTYSMIILAVVFTVFIGIGISSLRKASRIRGLVSEEENIVEKVETYIKEHFTDEYLASLKNEDLSEEEDFFHVTEILKKELIEQFPLFSKGYIDQLVDERYGEYCDKTEE